MPPSTPLPTVAPAEAPFGGLSQSERHLLRRFSYGINRGLAQEVKQAGGSGAWFERQLNPAGILDGSGSEVDSWFPSMQLTPYQLWARFRANRVAMSSAIASEDLSRRTLMRQVRSRRQVLEVMTEFWSNLLHVASPMDSCWPHRHTYDDVIRAHALGKFSVMLREAVTHPAMLLYLDSYDSTKKSPNENLGREVLECHTVGRQTAYTERDVRDSTLILTGWAVDRGGSWRPSYNSQGHHTGPVRVLGFSDANASPDGRSVTHRYLDYLAHHPATARRIAHRLATRFVSDTPPAEIVSATAKAYLASDTSITATLRALVAHPQFYSASRPKVRTPTEDFVATARALRIQVARPRSNDDLARRSIWLSTDMGQRPFNWPTPDGFPDSGAVWASAARMLASWTVHQSMASGTPSGGATYAQPQLWLPPLPTRLETVVSTMHQRLFYEDPTPRALNAACASVGERPGTVITNSHPVITERIPLLLAALLDSPRHMKR